MKSFALLQGSFLLLALALSCLSSISASPISSQPFADLLVKRQSTSMDDDLTVDLGYSKIQGYLQFHHQHQLLERYSLHRSPYRRSSMASSSSSSSQPKQRHRCWSVRRAMPAESFRHPQFQTSAQYEDVTEDCLFLNVFAPRMLVVCRSCSGFMVSSSSSSTVPLVAPAARLTHSILFLRSHSIAAVMAQATVSTTSPSSSTRTERLCRCRHPIPSRCLRLPRLRRAHPATVLLTPVSSTSTLLCNGSRLTSRIFGGDPRNVTIAGESAAQVPSCSTQWDTVVHLETRCSRTHRCQSLLAPPVRVQGLRAISGLLRVRR